MEEAGAELVGTLTYNTDLYSEGWARRVVRHYERVVAEGVRDVGRRMGR